MADGGRIMPLQKFRFSEGNSATYRQNCCELSQLWAFLGAGQALPADQRVIGKREIPQ
jgi:hypothetical protein